jgi:hypothetical protein
MACGLLSPSSDKTERLGPPQTNRVVDDEMGRRETFVIDQRNRCHRCSGMMVETYVDLLSPSDTGDALIGWRCLNCGEYMDPQVLSNRAAQECLPAAPFGLGRLKRLPQRARPIIIHQRTVAT